MCGLRNVVDCLDCHEVRPESGAGFFQQVCVFDGEFFAARVGVAILYVFVADE